MGRISTYTNATPVTLSDKFIGTEVAGTPVNVTKNFLISDLLTLFQANITLQNVLDAGNTATQSIILTGDITQTGGALSLGGTVRDFNGALGVNGETLVCNASGQLVFGSGLSNQNLEQLLAVGNTATNNINLTGNLNQTGNIEIIGNIEQTGNIEITAGNIELIGDIEQTGNVTQIGDQDITGDVTHIGNYLFENGQFTFDGNSTMLLEGAIKDSTNTLGGNGQILVSDVLGKVTWQSELLSSTTTVDAAGDPSANADVIFYVATSGSGTIYLDSALNVAGKKVVLVRKSTTTAANIGANGGALINGVSTKPLPTILYSTTTCVSDGTDWYCSNGQAL